MDSTINSPELARVRDFLAEQADITLAVVSGSMARGEANDDSDLDDFRAFAYAVSACRD